MNRLLCALSVLPLVLAGCATEAPATAFHATGSNAFVSFGWAYGGGAVPAEGTVAIDVDEATNQGRLTATVKTPTETWTVEWTNFSEAAGKPFQSGGIARDLVEHGATNVGDALVPELHLVSAGWGIAQLRRDGVPVLDPATGGGWTAHYMATDTGIRAADGRIKNKAGGPYDPLKPAEGANEPGDREIWIVLKPGATFPADFVSNATEAANSPQYSKEFPFKVEVAGPIRVDFQTSGPPTPAPLPVPTYDLTFTLVDANGTTVVTAKNAGTLDAAGLPGDYKVVVTGSAVQATYNLGILVDYPSNDPFVVLFEEVNW